MSYIKKAILLKNINASLNKQSRVFQVGLKLIFNLFRNLRHFEGFDGL